MTTETRVRTDMAGISGRGAAILPRPRSTHRRWDRTLTIQSAVVALLLVALIASLASGARGPRSHGGIVPAPLEGEPTVATYRENAARTAISPGQGPLTTPVIVWSQPNAGLYASSVLVADGVLYQTVGSPTTENDIGIEARTLATGERLWIVGLPRVEDPALLLAGDTLFVSTASSMEGGSGELFALNAGDGSQQWKRKTSGTYYSSPVYEDGVIYLAATNHTFQAYDADNGDKLWSIDLEKMASAATGDESFPADASGMQTQFSPAVANGIGYVTAGDGALYAIDLSTQSLLWHVQTRGNMLETPAIVGNSLYLPSCNWAEPGTTPGPDSDTCWLLKLDAATGAELASIQGWINLFAATDKLIIVSLDNHVSLLSAETLEEVSSLPTGLSTPVVTSNSIFVSDQAGTIDAYKYDAQTGAVERRWSVYTGSPSGSPHVVAGDLLIATGARQPGADDNTLIALAAGADATPVAGASEKDLSGLASCTPPAPVEWKSLSGEPAHTITDKVGQLTVDGAIAVDPPSEEERKAGYSSGAEPWIDFPDLPTGTAAPEEAVAGIKSTVDEIVNCVYRQYNDDASGFFSEDFFRRDHVRFVLGEMDYPSTWFLTGLFPTFLQASDNYRLLPDGRVAILAEPTDPYTVDDFAMFVVFVQQDGQWVVDEVLRVGRGALMG